jgi:hypothetical protein
MHFNTRKPSQPGLEKCLVLQQITSLGLILCWSCAAMESALFLEFEMLNTEPAPLVVYQWLAASRLSTYLCTVY